MKRDTNPGILQELKQKGVTMGEYTHLNLEGRKELFLGLKNKESV